MPVAIVDIYYLPALDARAHLYMNLPQLVECSLYDSGLDIRSYIITASTWPSLGLPIRRVRGEVANQPRDVLAQLDDEICCGW